MRPWLYFRLGSQFHSSKKILSHLKFREESAVDEKLKATDIDISDLNRRIKNQQILINELLKKLTVSYRLLNDQQSVLVNGTDCNGNQNQTNFTKVDNGLNDVRTSDEKVTDLPGEDDDLVRESISMNAGEEMMTIEADNGDGKTKVENASGKKKGM
ncbi:hypothetical protein GJ496_010850 [Pomphorhynchus laevis]|nr:hypothetical protein GJ496_010850 [Pomphorhynchus laevis]